MRRHCLKVLTDCISHDFKDGYSRKKEQEQFWLNNVHDWSYIFSNVFVYNFIH